MTELISKLITEHGLAAALAIANIAILLWFASKVFTALSDQNRVMGRLLERHGLDTEPPPVERPRRRGGRLLPRAPTPLPFFPPQEAAPEAVDDEPAPPTAPRRRR